MLVTFSTNAYADITMIADTAINMLKLMGQSGTVPSAVLSADIPAALYRLNHAINTESINAPVKSTAENSPTVSIARRALPLISMLSAAAKAKANVRWK